MADLIVTVPPSTVAAWPIGTSFEPGQVGETTNFLGPFSDTPIESVDGGASVNNVCYRQIANLLATVSFPFAHIYSHDIGPAPAKESPAGGEINAKRSRCFILVNHVNVVRCRTSLRTGNASARLCD